MLAQMVGIRVDSLELLQRHTLVDALLKGFGLVMLEVHAVRLAQQVQELPKTVGTPSLSRKGGQGFLGPACLNRKGAWMTSEAREFFRDSSGIQFEIHATVINRAARHVVVRGRFLVLSERDS